MTASPEQIAREEARQVFVRVCHDSGFRLSEIQAAQLTGRIVGAHPLQVWCAFPSLTVMAEIAAGTHPAVRRYLQEQSNDGR